MKWHCEPREFYCANFIAQDESFKGVFVSRAVAN